MSFEEDHRQHPRYAIELDAAVSFEGKRFTARTHDISQGGFCLSLPEPLPVNSVGQIRLALVFSENSFSEQLTLPATIVWCTPVGPQYQVGIKFGGMPPETEGYLSLFIQLLEGGEDDEDDDKDDNEVDDEVEDDD